MVKGLWGGLEKLGTHHDNSFVLQKIALRKWITDKIKPSSVLDCYGGNGEMFGQVWSKFNCSYSSTEGDALKWLSAHNLNYDIFDIDSYGSPWEALRIVNDRSYMNQIGIVCTDGALKRAGQIRGTIPRILVDAMGWDKTSRELKAWIFYHYPQACRLCLDKIMSNYVIERLAVKEHNKVGYCGTAYFAAVLVKNT